MKSLAELKAIRDKLQHEGYNMNRETSAKITVAMGTCGIAAGARNVLLALMEELATRSLQHVAITQTGCLGMCEKEPLVEVDCGGEQITYAYVTPEKAKRILLEHVINGTPVREWVVTKV